MTKEVRLRYAPSPTGHLHIGGARTALFNYLYARRLGGKFIVRIEDTDQVRNVENAAEKQMENLKWLGVDWDEGDDIGGPYGPYRCMDRLDIYKGYIEQLLKEGKAYYCYATKEELDAEREEQLARNETPRILEKHRHTTPEQKAAYEKEGRVPSVHFIMPENRSYTVNDLVRGEVTFDSNEMGGDFVICRPDGIPTYNFAVVIDDHLMKISHVVRGEEHLSNTPRQLMIYEAFGWEAPQFAHLALILNQEGKKMSKRDESIIQFIEQYRDMGYLPEAIVNFLVLLGWSPGGEQEIFSLEELSEKFSFDRVSKSPAVFDSTKMNWMNNHYLKAKPVDEIVDMCIPHLQEAGFLEEELTAERREWAKQIVALYQEQMSYCAQIVPLSALFFLDEVVYEEDAKAVLKEPQVKEVLVSFKEHIESADEYSVETINASLKAVQKATGYKGKALFMPVRVSITGQAHGRDLGQSIYLIGREKVLARLQQVISSL
ncbi:glutamate--tRNA ligase [Brevibacillus laterosporus]|uniref:glutamate--tRNA ligase n=1 Tax=Brevibacillus laterosporus TaxID=1465 RepID=UPI002650911F|nr:glutamate--tRNA ligase [Brevibacillus laterosporus]MDN9012267.1 glutamate--tRNA ligase [Brevibacillus laterosporus]MDO0943363.1 glutamate--tRNA ligase [Brevibacillus laterosporus]